MLSNNTWAFFCLPSSAKRRDGLKCMNELVYRFVREKKKFMEEEAKVMANVPGWKVGENVYNSGRWMPPSTGKIRAEC